MGQEKRAMVSGSWFSGTSHSRHDAVSIARPLSSHQGPSEEARHPSRLGSLEAHGPLPYTDRPAPVRYGMGLFAVGLATATRLALVPVVEGQFPFLTFFFALDFAAWFGGLGPSLVALAISLVTLPFLIGPQGT